MDYGASSSGCVVSDYGDSDYWYGASSAVGGMMVLGGSSAVASTGSLGGGRRLRLS